MVEMSVAEVRRAQGADEMAALIRASCEPLHPPMT